MILILVFFKFVLKSGLKKIKIKILYFLFIFLNFLFILELELGKNMVFLILF